MNLMNIEQNAENLRLLGLIVAQRRRNNLSAPIGTARAAACCSLPARASPGRQLVSRFRRGYCALTTA